MRKITLVLLILYVLPATAVYVNDRGDGDVLLIPYYTVNNDLNTLVTVTNTTEHSKAIKVNFREGLNGYAVLSYNVYMSPYDTWSFALVPTVSTVSGSSGQDSALQVSADNSCAPFLNKAGQEFLPFELTDGPQDMSRAREGFIEILEMGEPQDVFAASAQHSPSNGVPVDCAALAEAWQPGGAWDVLVNYDFDPGSGGLMAEADIINVAEGINYSIPVVALDGFFAAETTAHVHPGDSSLSLDAAAPMATVMADDKTYQLAFDSGIDAVSAVLMADELIGTYALDSIVAGKSEAVFVQPTRRFYTAEQGENNQPPYNPSNNRRLLCPTEAGSNVLSQYGGTWVDILIADRESQIQTTDYVIDPPPPRYFPAVCDSVSVNQLLIPGSVLGEGITGSNNIQGLYTPAFAVTENGFFVMKFQETRPLVGTDISNNQTIEMMGLPILGISLQKFTNAGAVEGLLAQYGGTHKFKSNTSLQEQQD